MKNSTISKLDKTNVLISSNPYTHKNIDEIEALIKSDPDFYRFYLMRINDIARKSTNSEIRKCQIVHLANKKRKVVIKEARDSYERIKGSNEEEAKMLQRDFEKVFELDDEFKKYNEQKCDTPPATSNAFFARGTSNGFMNFVSSEAEWYSLDSVKDLSRAIELSPNNYEAIFAYVKSKIFSLLHVSRANPLELIKQSKNIIRIEPNFALGHHQLAWQYYVSYDFENSIHEYDEFFKMYEMLDPEFQEGEMIAQGHFFRGKAHMFLGNLDRAIYDFKRGREFDCIFARVCPMFAGKCHEMQENFEKAILEYTIAINGDYGYGTEERNKVVQKLKEKIMKL